MRLHKDLGVAAWPVDGDVHGELREELPFAAPQEDADVVLFFTGGGGLSGFKGFLGLYGLFRVYGFFWADGVEKGSTGHFEVYTDCRDRV